MDTISYMEFIRRGMEDNIYNFTVHGKCSQCGKCCSRLLPMSEKEIREIKRYIRKHNIKECKHNMPLADPMIDLTCPFLDLDKSCEKCRIYPVRPMICKKFICDNEQRVKSNREEVRSTRRIVDVRSEFFW